MCFWKNGIGAEIDPPSPPPPAFLGLKIIFWKKLLTVYVKKRENRIGKTRLKSQLHYFIFSFPKLINNLLEEFDEPAVRLRSCNTGIKGNTGSTVLATEKTPISSNSCWSCISWLQNVNKYSLSNKKSVPTNSPATNSLSTNKC